MIFRIMLLFCLLTTTVLPAADSATIPVSYAGRYRPMEAYARLWLQETYGKQALRKADLNAFGEHDRSAVNLVLKLHLVGPEAYPSAPLFYLKSASDKQSLGLDLKRSHFSYRELQASLEELSSAATSPPIQKLRERLTTRPELRVLPAYQRPGEWLSLDTLRKWQGKENFTALPEDTYERLQSTFSRLDQALQTGQPDSVTAPLVEQLADILVQGYESLAGQPVRRSMASTLYYPTQRQLQAELLYYRLPLVTVTIGYYIIGLAFLFLANRLQRRGLDVCAWTLLFLGFFVHTAVLALRCYILQRPPVSNMFETLLFVPWVAMLIGLLWRGFGNSRLVLGAGALASILLLTLLQVTRLDSGMENVQAVLDSQYWLIIHVLMIVSSYGVFLLCGILGHLYLLSYPRRWLASKELSRLATAILHTMYLGTALLIPGTILGGVWAAQSWGRFWDWDPKESWAFITTCVYLIFIHLYRFQRIGSYGLAMGSVVGLLAVSFTWYGVNYLLGTGLHSYGFGAGGEFWYAAYFVAEIAFLALCYRRCRLVSRQGVD